MPEDTKEAEKWLDVLSEGAYQVGPPDRKLLAGREPWGLPGASPSMRTSKLRSRGRPQPRPLTPRRPNRTHTRRALPACPRQGCGHVRLMVSNFTSYGLSSADLPRALIKSFYRYWWAAGWDQTPKAAAGRDCCGTKWRRNTRSARQAWPSAPPASAVGCLRWHHPPPLASTDLGLRL
jgi:hypothetical protein